MIFPSEEIKLTKIYPDRKGKGKGSVSFGSCRKISEVYGEFSFPDFPSGRIFTLGSFVQSVDGKIAFPESPDGTLVAKANTADPGGALADYWILNMLRTVCDCVLMGGAMIAREPELTGRIFDSDLSEWRGDNGLTPVPVHILVTGRGASIPSGHPVLNDTDIPVLIVTTEEGQQNLTRLHSSGFETLDSSELSLRGPGGIRKNILVCGSSREIDIPLMLKILKGAGLNSMLIESPTFLSHLLRRGLLDELFLNTSSIFVGGDALSLGDNSPAFSTKNRPLLRVVSIHSHSPYFFYTRYRME